MADVHLIWYTVDDTANTASRADVRQWADELGLPQGPLSRGSKTTAFLKGCAVTTHYRDDAGRDWTITAREIKRKPEFITYLVAREDGLKMAHLKFFLARRDREGIVVGTHVTKSLVSRSLPATDMHAARQWLAEADRTFRAEQGQVPWYIIRRLVRAGILEAGGVPVRRRPTVFFAYADELEPIHRAGELLVRSMENAEVQILAIDDACDYQVFAQSADEFLDEAAGHLMTTIGNWMGQENKNRPRLNRQMSIWKSEHEALARRHAQHERRLRLALPQTGSTLSRAAEIMAELLTP